MLHASMPVAGSGKSRVFVVGVSICTLGTNEKGCGIYLIERRERELILPPERFVIPPGTEKAGANRLLAETLNSIGWGPQVDQCGNIIL